jgi:hypothetical protein
VQFGLAWIRRLALSPARNSLDTPLNCPTFQVKGVFAGLDNAKEEAERVFREVGGIEGTADLSSWLEQTPSGGLSFRLDEEADDGASSCSRLQPSVADCATLQAAT